MLSQKQRDEAIREAECTLTWALAKLQNREVGAAALNAALAFVQLTPCLADRDWEALLEVCNALKGIGKLKQTFGTIVERVYDRG